MANTHAAPAPKNVFAGMIADYAEAQTELFRRRIFAKTVRELESLNDAQLADIGVPRAEIKQRAYQNVYRGVSYHN
ncbi:DUF1127 domain-containing protein [Ruegeria lacuscaerulensis]|uniref:DUF1127 domain-containing protein n=1 Tax=Ruegeria lacuscaerulensis TaxID=55218 RepID=UPI00147AC732|nr:DUF1127 domain-containing protein [Ruegeria lacuscaerulensis]